MISFLQSWRLFMNNKLLLLSPILVLTQTFQTLECRQKVDAKDNFDVFWQELDQRFEHMHREMAEMSKTVDKLFANFGSEQSFNKLNVKEHNGNLVVNLTLPDIDAPTLDVSIDEQKDGSYTTHVLSVHGTQVKEIKNDKQEARKTTKEFRFVRTLPYTVNIESTKAECRNGVLTITMQKDKPKNNIPVTVK
jgi:HSP20 family molecular chaperone IbpA